MKDAIHALKYGRLHAAAHGLGRMLAEAIGRLAADAPGEMLVVPIPLHRSKYAERGFNQARLLAAEALGFVEKSHPEWRLTMASSTLMRLRATESQAGLNPHERRLNVRGAFSVSDPAAVKLKDVLVIDDILTTGGAGADGSGSRIRVGGNAGPGTDEGHAARQPADGAGAQSRARWLRAGHADARRDRGFSRSKT
jgi:hypothetical protein